MLAMSCLWVFNFVFINVYSLYCKTHDRKLKKTEMYSKQKSPIIPISGDNRGCTLNYETVGDFLFFLCSNICRFSRISRKFNILS